MGRPPVTIGPDFEIGHPITPSGGEPGFGGSIALSGDGARMLIGGNHFITGSGPVYVFKRAGAEWTELQKLTPPPGVEFGEIALAANGNTALSGRRVAWKPMCLSAGFTFACSRS